LSDFSNDVEHRAIQILAIFSHMVGDFSSKYGGNGRLQSTTCPALAVEGVSAR